MSARIFLPLLIALHGGWNSALDANQAVYANLDSVVLVQGELVLIGGADKFEYGYLDTLHVALWVENRTAEPYAISALHACQGAEFVERWCPPAEDTLYSCVPVGESSIVCQDTGVHFVNPGRTMVQEIVMPPFADFVIPRDWTFDEAWVRMPPPWRPPYVDLQVSYRRLGPTAIQGTTWTALKSLFR